MQRFEEFILVFNKFKDTHDVKTRTLRLVGLLEEHMQMLNLIMNNEVDINVDCTLSRVAITLAEQISAYINSVAIELATEFGIETRSNIDKSHMDWFNTIKTGLGMNGDYEYVHHFISKEEMDSLQDYKKFYIEDKFGNILGVGKSDLFNYIDLRRVAEMAAGLKERI